MEKVIGEARQVGNSSGVLLPKSWLNRKVIVTLAKLSEKEILREIFEILYDKNILGSVLGIYLVGSYARKEETEESDIDILVITKDLDRELINAGIYSILVVSEELIQWKLKENLFPIGPMLKEARALLNAPLIERYKDFKLTRKNLDFHIETTKSALNVVRSIIEMDESLGKKYSKSISYSLVLRLRGVYIVDCLIKGKVWKKGEFLKFLEKIAGSKKAYEGYLKTKANQKGDDSIDINEAKKLAEYISKKIKDQEKWAKRKK